MGPSLSILFDLLFDLRLRRFDKLIKLEPVPITCSSNIALKKVKVHLF